MSHRALRQKLRTGFVEMLFLKIKEQNNAVFQQRFVPLSVISLVPQAPQEDATSIGAHIFDSVKNMRSIFEMTTINKQDELAKFYRGEIHHLAIL